MQSCTEPHLLKLWFQQYPLLSSEICTDLLNCIRKKYQMIQRYITISYQIYQLQYRLLSSEIWTDLLNWSRVAMDCHLKIKNKEEYLTYRFAGPWVHVRDSIIPPCFEIFPSQLWSMFSLSGKKNCALHWAIPPFFARKGTKHNTLFVKSLYMAMTV